MRMPEDVFRFPDPPLFHPERWRPKKGMAKAPSDTMQVDEEDSDGDLPELSTTVLVERQTSKTADEHYKRYLDTASRDIVTASGSKQLHQMLRKDEVGAFASQYANAPQIFAGHVIFLAEDVACSDAVVDSLERRVQASGGAFVSGKGLDALEADEALLAADMVICAHRSGWTYWKVRRASSLPKY